jgi:hypothetical protein
MALPGRTCLFLLLAVLAGACHARAVRGESLLFTLEDPRGDDHGDGELRYPLRENMTPGSMDLLSVRAYAQSGGTLFEATFARPIAQPQRGRTVDLAGGTQAQMARHGFYTFNLDIYVDQDRVEGSGRTDTLPGRHLTLDAGSAWEKVIALTPRPFEARDMLRKLWREAAREEEQQREGPLSESALRALNARVERELAERIFFPTRIRVTGSTVAFFVPEEFLGEPARATWGYAVAVTGATEDRRVEMPAILGGVTQVSQGLMVLGIRPGVSHEFFGGGRLGDPRQSPVVDLLVPEGVRQEEVLGPRAPPWPAVVPGAARLPQAPDTAGASGEGDAPGAGAP